MSSQQFIETLKQIGYPKADSLSSRALDWMFEDKAVLPFLNWFCNTVGQQNVLGAEEKAAFEALEQNGEGILEGPQLEAALACLSSTCDKNVSLSLATLDEDIECLKEDAERQRKRKQKLVQARNKLSMHHTGLTHRLMKLSDLEGAAKQRYKRSLGDCKRVSSESKDSMDRLLCSTKRLLALYQDIYPSENASGERTGVFLSNIPLDTLYRAEEKYTKELTSFTKKQFFDGIADVAGGETSRYQLLEVSDPMSLLIKAPSQQEFMQDCEELARLQAVFPKSESEQLNAMVEEECACSVLLQAEFIIRTIQAGSFPKATYDIGGMLENTNVALTAIRQDLKELTEGEVPALIRKLAMLQETTVLTGDYCLKLARQDYFTSNQDQVIKYLLEQRARNEFLTMAYEVEARSHREVNRLLTAVGQTLQARVFSYEERMKVMSDPLLTKVRYERSTIDTRDVASACLHRVLVPADEKETRQLYLAYNHMVSAAENLKQKHTASKAETVATADKYQNKLKELETEVCRCEDVLYAESSTVGGQPLMMPLAVQEAMTELEDVLKKLESALVGTVSDISAKKKSLKSDVLLVKERELFTNFHLHPERLHMIIDSLEQRLQAQSVL